MNSKAPEPEQLAAFARLRFIFLGFLTLAVVVWEVQDFAASFAATEMKTQTTLRTTKEHNDARVWRAFDEARRSLRVKATLTTEPNPDQQTRDAALVVVAKSKAETLEGREQMVQTMQRAFTADGGDELFDIGTAPSASPVQNAPYLLVKRCFRFGALVILLLGLMKLAMGWKQSNLPRAALFGILATAFTLALVVLGDDAAPIWFLLIAVGPPAALLALIWVLTRRVQRARSWHEGRARITASKVQVERHRFAGDTTKVRNLPCVEYEFEVPGKGMLSGDTISLGFGTADNVDVVLKRYPVGATVPVYYDSKHPQECALEREAPISIGGLWGVGITFALIYVTVALSLSNVIAINRALASVLPGINHPVLVLITGALGLLALCAGIWNMLHPRKAFQWTRTTGKIVSSETESFTESDSGQRAQTFYRPVIEFSYTVEGQEYRGSSGSSAVTISAGQKWADAEVARYPVGMEVPVFYDPQNPTQSGLKVNTDLMLNGRASLIVAAILFGVACYAALH